MGNSSTSQLQVAQPLSSQWIPNGSESYCTILKNIQTSQQLQQYSITSFNTLQQQMNIYQRRHHQNSNLVKVISVEKQTYNGFCSGSIKLIVTTQRIPKRLSQLKNLKYQECISILYSCLVAFKAIYQEVGFIVVNDEMIGFTPNNKCRVWLNQNFSKNHPQNQYQDPRNPDGVYSLIMEIISVVSKHSILPLDEFNYFVKLILASNPSFDLAINKLEEFIKITFIGLPTQLTLVEQKRTQEFRVIKPESKIQQVKVGNQPCVVTSDVFQINPKQPNIQQKYNKSVEIAPRVLRQHTPDKQSIHYQRIINVKPQPLIVNQNLPIRQILIVPQNTQNRSHSQIRNHSLNQRKVIFESIKSPQHNIFYPQNSSIVKRSLPKHNQIIQKYPPVQYKNPAIHPTTPKLNRCNINSLNNFTASLKKQNYHKKQEFFQPKLSRFHPNPQPQAQNIIPTSFTPIKLLKKQSSGNNSLQTTGQFAKLHQVQDFIISEQVSSQSNRMNSFIPLSPNDDQRLHLQQIVATIKSDLDDVEISKNTIVLVDKLHSNQHLPSSRIEDKAIILTESIKQSKQQSQQLQWSDFQSVHKQSNMIIPKDHAAVTFGAASRKSTKQNRWLSPEHFKQYTPIQSIHINSFAHQNPEIRKITRGVETDKFTESKSINMNSRSKIYL